MRKKKTKAEQQTLLNKFLNNLKWSDEQKAESVRCFWSLFKKEKK
jgi:hypothetical protein